MKITAELRDQALHVAAVLEPETLTGEQAVSAVQDLATAERAAASALMFTALRVARTSAWQGQGFASAADWLSAQVGISVREAAGLLGTAKKADRMPKTKEAMKKGDLSPDQAGAVTDAATADPSAEDDLLDSAARDTNKVLKDKAAKAKAAATDSATRERRIRSERSLRRGTDAEGAFWLRLRGPGVDAAGFEELLRPFEEHLFRHGRSTGERDTFENRSYDAFMAMHAWFRSRADHGTSDPGRTPEATPVAPPAGHRAPPADTAEPSRVPVGPAQRSGSHGEAPDDAGVPGSVAPASGPPRGPIEPAERRGVTEPGQAEPAPQGDGSPPTWRPAWDPGRAVPLPTKLPGGNNTKVIVLVDHTALLRGHTLAGETCEIAGVGPVSVTAVREILHDDPFLAVAIRKGHDIVNVSHHGRGLNAHQRTAIEANGLRCSNRACNRAIAIQIDHRVPYGGDQVTELPNQDPLCPECHRKKTHEGWCLEDGNGPRRFLPPDGERRTEHRDPAPGDDGLPADSEPVEPVERIEQMGQIEPASFC
ncbi:hypothetical protein [Aquihabitans sp. McL0605]|uniref:HNH endonuclease signature motif containing protein n=1 Tax=Aquihabitans sp. McL0605 TaxID=3415671 RepID=UPI003CE68429